MKRNKWSFQLLPNVPGIVGNGFRMDTAAQDIEDEVNAALPYHFRFHKVGKLVIGLGVPSNPQKDYLEVLGVATKQYPDFDLRAYKALAEEEKKMALRKVTLEVFAWLSSNFVDAQCFVSATEKLNWANQALLPTTMSVTPPAGQEPRRP